jgi:hypothetical protein
MLHKIKPYTTTILIAAVLFTMALAYIIPVMLFRAESSYESSSIDGPGIYPDAYLPFDTLLTYQAFRQYESEQQGIKDYRKYVNNGSGDGISLSFIGAGTTRHCDTCTTLGSSMGHEVTRYYLLLPGYAFKHIDTKFFRKQDSNFVQVAHWDSEKQEPGGTKSRSGHFEYQQVPYRFRPDVTKNVAPLSGILMIPVSAGTYKILHPILQVLQIVLILCVLYIILVFPAKILIRIARGEIFTHHNIRQFNIIARIFLLLPFAVIAFQYLLQLIFHRYTTGEVRLQPWVTLYEMQLFPFLGLAALAIAKAFRKGFSLQEEQALTV